MLRWSGYLDTEVLDKDGELIGQNGYDMLHRPRG